MDQIFVHCDEYRHWARGLGNDANPLGFLSFFTLKVNKEKKTNGLT